MLLIAAFVLGSAALALGYLARDALGAARSASAQPPEAADGRIARTGGRRVVLRALDDEGRRVLDDPAGSVREQWAEAARRRALDEPLPPLVEALTDPQMGVFRRSFDAEASLPFAPVRRRGRLLGARGIDVPAGASCEVRVLPVRDEQFNCLVRVMCDGVVVYPNRAQTAGYVQCETDGHAATRAIDSMPTFTDGDPAVAVDLASGRVTVEDRNPDTTLFDVAIELEPARPTLL